VSTDTDGQGNQGVELVTRQVPGRFVSNFLSPGTTWWNLVLVSPWITPFDGGGHSMDRLLREIETQKIATYVITREPADEHPGHQSVVAALRSLPSVEMRFNPGLHAKIYLADGPQRSLGLIGSANLTQGGHTGIEIGVLLHGRGVGERLIRDLMDFCTWDLRQRSSLIKARTGRTQ
jgi:hypothetical protein